MEKLYTKRVDFRLVDEATTTDITEYEEVFSCQASNCNNPSLGQCRPVVRVKSKTSSQILDPILRNYGDRLCLRPEVCEIRTQTASKYGKSKRITEIPSDESFSDIIDLVLELYGNQPSRKRLFDQKDCIKIKNKTTSDQNTNTDPGITRKTSKTTQTTLLIRAVKDTNTRQFDTTFSLLKGVCFRFFFGPSLDEAGVNFWANFPMIRQFFLTIKAIIFTEQTDEDEVRSPEVQISVIGLDFSTRS